MSYSVINGPLFKNAALCEEYKLGGYQPECV